MKTKVDGNRTLGNVMSTPPAGRDDGLLGRLAGHFRHICAFLQPFNDTPRPQVIAFTSSVHGEGVTTIALGVAKCLASETMARVLLVECDLSKPAVYSLLGIPPEPGLSNLLAGKSDLEMVLRTTDVNGMAVIPAGTPLETPFPTMRIQWFAAFLESLKTEVDFVVLDLPPISSDPVSSYLANLSDAVYLVVRASVVPVDYVKESSKKLDHSKLKGAVLNGAKTELPRWLDRLL